MRTSESIKTIAAALVKAQAKMNGVTRDKINPHFKNHYASLDACWNACKPMLMENDIAVTQVPHLLEDGTQVLTTRLQHTSGEFIEGDYALRPVKDTPQEMGSCITYARRYSLCSMVGLMPDEDDDGHSASRGEPPPAQRATPSRKADSPKKELVSLVQQWAGVRVEDSVDAAQSFIAHEGHGKTISDAVAIELCKAVKEHIANGASFIDVVQGEKK